MAELQPSAPTSISLHEDRKLSCIPPPHADHHRKVSTASSVHERKISNVSSGLQSLQISQDNVLLREARSASVSAGNGPNSPTLHNHPHPHVPKKFIHTWRQACDKTKERTKFLINRWRTLPEGSPSSTPPDGEARGVSWGHSWAWDTSGDDPSSFGEGMTTADGSMEGGEAWWRCRGFPGQPPPPLLPLAPEQRTKLAQLFNTLLDTDSDGLVAPEDFHGLGERLCQFAGWKDNGPQACILREVISGLLEAFLKSLHSPPPDDCDSPTTLQNGKHSDPQSLGLFLGLDDWLGEWCQLLRGVRRLSDLPLWLQYFPKVLFAAINRTGNGVISREELRYFYTSFLGFDSRKVEEALNPAFDAMTANGDHNLNCSTYQLVFANFLMGRHPNGPGQYMFGPFGESGRHIDDTTFPVDYSAMNSLPEDLEEYSPGHRSNRRSRPGLWK